MLIRNSAIKKARSTLGVRTFTGVKLNNNWT